MEFNLKTETWIIPFHSLSAVIGHGYHCKVNSLKENCLICLNSKLSTTKPSTFDSIIVRLVQIDSPLISAATVNRFWILTP